MGILFANVGSILGTVWYWQSSGLNIDYNFIYIFVFDKFLFGFILWIKLLITKLLSQCEDDMKFFSQYTKTWEVMVEREKKRDRERQRDRKERESGKGSKDEGIKESL